VAPLLHEGDLALLARPVTGEEFSAFGHVIEAGSHAWAARKGKTRIAFERLVEGARRVTHLRCFPDAHRSVHAVSSDTLWLVVLRAGERPGGVPSAFAILPGQGVVLDAGVWHAGPYAVQEALLCEVMECPAAAERMDQRSLADLCALRAVSVRLPEEPGAPKPGLVLDAPHAVLFDAQVAERWRLGLLELDGLTLPDEAPDLRARLQRECHLQESKWPEGRPASESGAIRRMRLLFEQGGADPSRSVTTPERLLAHVLSEGTLPPADPLSDAIALLTLRTQLPFSVHDADRIGDGAHVRLGDRAEVLRRRARGGRVPLGGVPALCDREGAFGTPVGDAPRTAPGPRTRRALLALFLPAGVGREEASGLLDDAEGAVRALCGPGRSVRLLLGWPGAPALEPESPPG